jgi:DNA-binding GntR family transcriptional regulator
MRQAAAVIRRHGAYSGDQSPVVLTPVARETVQTQVYRELRRALMHGRFTPGQVLTIVDLAKSLNTSTMPVRDALSRLISEQALEAMPNRSVRVPLISIERLLDLRRARTLIEGEALALALPRLTPDDLASARLAIRDYDGAIAARGVCDIEEELDANYGFHMSLYLASGSAILMPIIESLWLQSGPIIRAATLAFDPTSKVSGPHYHSEIVEALEARNSPAARHALESDIGRAFDLLISQLSAPNGASPADQQGRQFNG